MTSQAGESKTHRWVLVDYDDPDEHEVCTRCGAQRNRHGRIEERAKITGGWPEADCDLRAALITPDEAFRCLSEGEQQAYRDAQQSVVDARRSANRVEGEQML